MACVVTQGITYFDGIILLLIQGTALFGNSLFFLGIIKFPSLRNATNILLCCLATADIVVALGPMNVTFAVYICKWGPRKQQIGDDIINKMYIFTDVWCATVSILSLTVIAMDRYFAINWPFIHQRVVKTTFAVCTIITVWLISAANAALRFFPTLPRRPKTLTNIMVAYGIPMIIMTYCYVNIAIIARRQTIRIAELNAAGNSVRMRDEAESSARNKPENEDSGAVSVEGRSTSLKPDTIERSMSHFSKLRRGTMGAYTRMKAVGRELKAAKTLGIVMGAFVVAWTPFMALNIIGYIHCNPPGAKCYEMLTPEIVRYCKFLHYFSSALNPCLYILLNKKWRIAFKRLLCCFKNVNMSNSSMTSLAGGW